MHYVHSDLNKRGSACRSASIIKIMTLYSVSLAEVSGIPTGSRGFFRILVKKAGIRANFHLLRHTHATELLAAGVDPRLVSDRLGHATVAFTLDAYGHVIPDMEQDAVDKIGANVEF
jgi:integrase